jgi:hypothetical protein
MCVCVCIFCIFCIFCVFYVFCGFCGFCVSCMYVCVYVCMCIHHTGTPYICRRVEQRRSASISKHDCHGPMTIVPSIYCCTRDVLVNFCWALSLYLFEVRHNPALRKRGCMCICGRSSCDVSVPKQITKKLSFIDTPQPLCTHCKTT